MIKKCVSIILSFVMCVSIFSNTVFAVNVDASRSLKENYLPNTIYVSTNEDGRYIDSNQENNIKGEMTNEIGVYALEDGVLLSYTGAETYQQVEKITMSLTDSAAITDLFESYSLTEEVKRDLLEKSQTAIENRNHNATFSLIVPYEAMVRGTYNVDYTYNGKPMRDTFIYYYGIDTGMHFIKKGTGGRDFANLTSDIILIGAGFAMTPVDFKHINNPKDERMKSIIGDKTFVY